MLALFATPKFAIQGYVYANKLGWKPKLTINNAVSSASNIMTLASEGGQNKVVNGSISIVFLKDPTDPKWAKDATMKLYRSIMKKLRVGRERERRVPRVRHGGRVDDGRAAEEDRQEPHARRRSSRRPRDMNLPKNPFLLPGIAIRTSATDHFPLEQMLLQRWSNGNWRSFGGIWSQRAALEQSVSRRRRRVTPVRCLPSGGTAVTAAHRLPHVIARQRRLRML